MSNNKINRDRRKEPRYQIWSDVKVMTPDGTHFGSAKNISGGGMEIQLSKCINPNIELTVSMKLHEEYIFRGMVVWTLGDYINNEWVYRVGIKTRHIVSKSGIAKMPQERRDLIRRLLPYIPSVKIDEAIMARKAA